MAEPTPQPSQSHPGHETRDVKPRTILALVIGLAALTLVAVVAIGGVFKYLNARQAQSAQPVPPLVQERRLPPQPRLQVEPGIDLERLRTAEDERLNSYGWVNRQAGVVRIPIERAMALIAERGLPVRDGEGRKENGKNQK